MTNETGNEEDKNRLISLPEAAKRYAFNRRYRYLSAIARKGRLKAQKIGGVWLTTPIDIEEYIRSRKRKGAYLAVNGRSTTRNGFFVHPKAGVNEPRPFLV